MATPAAEIALLRFGVFELDLRRQELRRAGVLVKLTPQQFRVLRMLAEHAGEVCTRERIQREIWGGEVFVDFERGLNVCVAAIRAALNDSSEGPRFIQTVPRQGYRFMAPVEQVEARAELPAARRQVPWRLLAVLAPAVAVAAAVLWWVAPKHTTMLVVLPFQNLTARDADGPVAAGLTDELTTQLGAADPQRLAVIGATSAARYAARKAGLAEVRRELGVQYVVEGGVRVEEGQVRVTVRLVEERNQTQVWSGSYQNGESGKLAFQETVAANVARAVETKLFPAREPVARELYSTDEQAREAYWNGRYLERKQSERAVEWFEASARRDPKFAAPRAAMAEAWLVRALTSQDGTEAFAKARSAAEDALRLDERNAEAHDVLGAVLFWNGWNRKEARRHFERALALNPSLARAHHDIGFLLVVTGEATAGIAELRTALALDPLSPRVNIDAGWVFLQARRYDEAARHARRAMELEPRLEEARACLARAELYQGKAREDVSSMRGSANPYSRAMAAAIAGDSSGALAELEEALRQHSPMLVMLGSEPAFDRLRAEARFEAVRRQVGLLR